MLYWLRGRDDVRLIGPDDAADRAPTVSILPLSKSVEEVHRGLTERRVMTGFGHFYGVRPLDGMRVATDPGVLRVSFLHYTTDGEIDHLIAGLGSALA